MSLQPGNVGPLERLTSFIHDSPTIYANAGVQIDSPAHKAVKFDANGNVVLANNGQDAIGLILSSTLDPIAQGAPVHILIKYIGLADAGGEIAAGDLVTINSTGQAVKAASGNFIFGRAFTSVGAAGEAVQVQINHMGELA